METSRPGETIRVVIADDHQVVRTGLERLLEGWPNVTVVGTAANGAEAVQLASLHRPDVVLMDISMPTMGGLEATRRIVTAWPEVQVVVLTSFDDGPTVAEALDAGAIGYLLKDSDPATLREGIESAAHGGSPLNPRVARSRPSPIGNERSSSCSVGAWRTRRSPPSWGSQSRPSRPISPASSRRSGCWTGLKPHCGPSDSPRIDRPSTRADRIATAARRLRRPRASRYAVVGRSGGTGRRGGLKIRCPRGRVSSNLTFGTTFPPSGCTGRPALDFSRGH